MNTINTNLSSKKVDYKDLINFILAYYKLDNITLNMFENARSVEYVSTNEVEIVAFLEKLPLEHTYNLHVKPGAINTTIICHELCHLNQYETGRLKQLPDKNFIWDKIQYSKSTPYNMRGWENEAFKMQNTLWKLYKKSKKEE